MNYTYSLPTLTSFSGKGLSGYTFGPLNDKDLEIYYIEVELGHDTYMVSKKVTRVYYVLSGSGYFTIADRKYNVSSGMLVEVPPRVEFCYSGRMKLLAVSKPRSFSGNDTFTKWNPDVFRGEFSYAADDWLTRLVRLRVFGKSPVSAYLKVNQLVWDGLPASFTALRPVRSYGNFLHTLARVQGIRAQAFNTFFLRNRPELELIGRLVSRSTNSDALRIAVLGCSTGAEAYSVAWTIRSARPDLKVMVHAMDISKQAVEVGKCGVYSLSSPLLPNTDIFERMTRGECEELFDRVGDVVTVKSCIKELIKWDVGDVGEPEVVDSLGPQDIVVANNFLCHMDDAVAERCLRNIARLVSPHGYLVVSGIDVDVRTKVAADLGWRPVQELLEEIHEGDPCMRRLWPCHYGGVEPLNKTRDDWRLRYASVFQLMSSGE